MASLNSADLSRHYIFTSKKPAKGFLVSILSGFFIFRMSRFDRFHREARQARQERMGVLSQNLHFLNANDANKP